MRKIKLLLIEDNRLLRDGIKAILGRYSDICLVASAGEGKNTIEKVKKLKPDVILLDLGLRSQNSLLIVESVRKDFPDSKIIVMDLAPVQADILQYVKAGATGFILKDASLNDFIITIRTVADGSTVLPSILVNSLFSQIVENAVKEKPAALKDSSSMTKREREIIVLLGDGLTNKEIAQKICASTFTVKSHIHNIMEKLALHTRLEVANYSYSAETIALVEKSISRIANG